MPYGRSRRGGRGMSSFGGGRGRRRGMPPQPGRGTPRTGINRPGQGGGATSSCAGISNPQARDECMRAQQQTQQQQTQQQQQFQGDTGGPAPPTGPGRTDPRGGGLRQRGGGLRQRGGGLRQRGPGGPRGRMRPPRRGRGGFGGGGRSNY